MISHNGRHWVRSQDSNYEEDAFLALKGLTIGRRQGKSTSNYTRWNSMYYRALEYRLEPCMFLKQGMVNKSPTESGVYSNSCKMNRS